MKKIMFIIIFVFLTTSAFADFRYEEDRDAFADRSFVFSPSDSSNGFVFRCERAGFTGFVYMPNDLFFGKTVTVRYKVNGDEVVGPQNWLVGATGQTVHVPSNQLESFIKEISKGGFINFEITTTSRRITDTFSLKFFNRYIKNLECYK